MRKTFNKIINTIDNNINTDNQLKKVDKVIEILKDKELKKTISILCSSTGIGLYLESIGKL